MYISMIDELCLWDFWHGYLLVSLINSVTCVPFDEAMILLRV